MDLLLEDSSSPASLTAQTADEAISESLVSEFELRKFHDAVVLMCILGAVKEAKKSATSWNTWSSDVYKEEYQLLDQLAFLCDHEGGGKTVTSIAAEETTTGITYWVASNYRPRQRVLTHLRWVLGELQTIGSSALCSTLDIEARILCESVGLSKKRVDFYRQRLNMHVTNIRLAETGVLSRADKQLLDDIEAIGSQETRSGICSSAFQFPHTEIFRLLRSKASEKSTASQWRLIKHYIGRLGSWVRACKILIHMAQTSPQMFSSCEVGVVEGSRPITTAFGDVQPTLQDLLRRNFPSYNEDHLQSASQSILKLTKSSFLEETLNAYNYQNFQPIIHAEVLMMEHFYKNELNFFNNDRYIGCSKPSCYCCDLYMRLHPGDFIPRSCHGNVYIPWTTLFDVPEGTHWLESHTVPVLTQMTAQIRQEILGRLMNDEIGQGWTPDSSTGITASIQSHLLQKKEIRRLWKKGNTLPQSRIKL